jgi:hypothetical protein
LSFKEGSTDYAVYLYLLKNGYKNNLAELVQNKSVKDDDKYIVNICEQEPGVDLLILEYMKYT